MRKTGHYWILIHRTIYWVAYWSNLSGYWQLPGMKDKFYDHEFDWIADERIEEP